METKHSGQNILPEDSQDKCMICLEKISANICLLGCSHAFHDYCIVPWFAWQEINATQDTRATEFSCCACRAPVKYCTHGPMESPDPCNPSENNNNNKR